MKALIVYDTTGTIITIQYDDAKEPTGIPFLWVDIPTGKQVTSIDVSATPNVAILTDLSKTQEEILSQTVTQLSLENADLKQQIQTLSQTVASLSVQ